MYRLVMRKFTTKDANRSNTDKNGVHDSLIVPLLLLVLYMIYKAMQHIFLINDPK